jgi:hypothetical protein
MLWMGQFRWGSRKSADPEFCTIILKAPLLIGRNSGNGAKSRLEGAHALRPPPTRRDKAGPGMRKQLDIDTPRLHHVMESGDLPTSEATGNRDKIETG